MELVEDWQLILRRAWSIKFSILAAILGGIELAVQLIQPADVRPGLFAGIAALISMGAAGARLLAQKEITDARAPQQ